MSKYPRYKKSLIVGPDTTRPQPNHKESELYLAEFLDANKDVVDAVTWHQLSSTQNVFCLIVTMFVVIP